jgi:hypothetical protein
LKDKISNTRLIQEESVLNKELDLAEYFSLINYLQLAPKQSLNIRAASPDNRAASRKVVDAFHEPPDPITHELGNLI